MATIKPISLLKEETLEEEVQRFHEWQGYYQKETDKLIASHQKEVARKHEIIAELTSENAKEREARLKDGFWCKCHDFRTIGALHEELVELENLVEKIKRDLGYYGND